MLARDILLQKEVDHHKRHCLGPSVAAEIDAI